MVYHTEIRRVKVAKTVIEYQLTRKPVKNINLRIKPTGKVYVSANNSVAVEYIDDFIKEKQKFIIKALNKFEEKQKKKISEKKEFVSGDTYKILGKKLVLIVLIGDKEFVKSNSQYIFLTVKDKNQHNKEHKEKLINKWIEELTLEIFKEICLETHEKFKKYGLKYPNRVTIRDMTTRWGSCRPNKGNITLNSKLIQAPMKSIEYVVIHEFAHFIHPNHSKQFYDLIEEIMPDWNKWKKTLDNI